MLRVLWLPIVITAAPYLLVSILKMLLDFRLAHLAVKYLFWLPFRNYFRDKPVKVAGTWEHIWGPGGSSAYERDVDRHGHSKIRQLDKYIYAEFYSQGVLYAFFGQIKQSFIVGDWYDVKDGAGYFGVFQLEIINSKDLRGLWLGHSKQSRAIRSDSSLWKRIDG